MREHLGVVLRAAERLEPLGRAPVLLGRAGARDLAVGDVADEDVRGTRTRSRPRPDRRSRRTNSFRSSAWSVASIEPCSVQRVAAPGQKTLPRTAASWSSSFSSGGSGSSRAAMSPWTVSGSGRSSIDAALGEHARELLGVERVAAGAREQRLLGLGRQHGLRRAARRAGAPSRRPTSGASESVGAFSLPPPQPGRRSSSSGRAVQTTSSGTSVDPVDEVVDEVEQAVVRPVEVLEDEHERALLGERLEEAPPGRERLSRAVLAELGRVAEADERPQSAARPRPRPRRRRARRDRLARASRSASVGRVGLEDPGLRLDHLAEGPEASRLRRTAATALAPVDQLRLALDALRKSS